MIHEHERKIINQSNDTYLDYKGPKTVIEIFNEVCSKYADNTALKYKDESMSYQQFHDKVNQLTHYILKNKLDGKRKIGIYMNRSFELMIAIYAVVKSGCAYVPLDPIYPDKRLQMIAQDSEIDTIITDSEAYPEAFEGTYHMIVFGEEFHQKLEGYSTENPPVLAKPDDNIYIIFTSGTTGRPKGVVIQHQSVCNGFYWLQDYLSFQPEDSELLKTSINFDLSIWELFWPLLAGGTLVITESEKHKDPQYIVDMIQAHNISIINFVPSMLQTFLENAHSRECTSLRTAFCIGEALEKHHVQRFYHTFSDCILYNLYGPTEATVHVSYHKCEPDEECTIYSIGKPIANTQMYVLDEELNMLPIGEIGELYIGGICLSPGYYNRKDLTEERFVPNPFSDDKESCLYKTGDLACFEENGEISFYGRSDFQVKYHGFRIETEEIEKNIRDYPLVKDCAVTMWNDKEHNDQKLVAHVILTEESGDDQAVNSWRQIYNETYQTDDVQENSVENANYGNIWRSSYTGKGFHKEEFEELADSTGKRILDLAPKNVLEIGCGNGYVLHRIIQHVNSYTGLDLSEVAIRDLKKSVAEEKYDANIRLFVSEADELDQFEAGEFDCIIINSVIQYFPSLQYLENVIEKSLRLLGEDGFLYIGDIRNYDLQELFESSVQVYKNNRMSVGELKKNISMGISHEKELLVSQQHIGYLQNRYPEIAGIQINNRIGVYANEMTKFRYDAVFLKGKIPQSEEQKFVVDCSEQKLTLELFEKYITDVKGKVVFTNVDNTFLQRDQYVLDVIKYCKDTDNVQEVVEKAQVDSNIEFYDIPIVKFCEIANKRGYRCFVKVCTAATCELTVTKSAVCVNVEIGSSQSQSEYANVPKQIEDTYDTFSMIKEHLKENLPEYMIPSLFIKKEKFEYLPNGKLDRRALNESIEMKRTLSSELVGAQNEVQKEITEIWKEILRIQDIGIRDSFIELGGHSLLAIRMLDKVKNQYQMNISMVDFFLNPTVEGMSLLVGDKKKCREEKNVKLPEVKRYKPYPLLPLQQSYYIGRQTNIVLGKVPTHIYCEVEFENYDHKRLEQAVNHLVSQNGTLKSRFMADGTQYELESVPYCTIPCDDLTGMERLEQEEKMMEKRSRMSYLSIDLAKDMPVVFSASKLTAKKAIVSIYADCICFDGWSFEKLLEKLDILYSDLATPQIPGVTYQEYEEYFRLCTDQEQYQRDKEYWLNRIDNLPEIPNISLLERPENIKDIQYIHKERTIDSEKFARFTALASQYEVSPFAIMLTVYGKTIASFCQNQRFLVNVPIAKRPYFMENVNMLLGECSDFFLFDYWNKNEETLLEAAKRNQKIIWEMNDHSSFTGTDIVREIYQRNQDRSNLIAPFVFTSLLDIPVTKTTNFRKHYYETHTSQVWMDIVLVRCNDNIQINFESVKGLIAEELIDKIADLFVELVDDFVNDKWSYMTEVELSKEERKTAIPDMVNVEITEQSLIALLDHSSKIHHNRVLLKTRERVYTYEEIFEQAKRLAGFIRRTVGSQNKPVCVDLPRGIMQYVSALAILYSGNIYTPLDYEYNTNIIKECANNVGAVMILTSSRLAEEMKELESVFIVDVEQIDLKEEIMCNEFKELGGDDVICIIHTSGSTGKPKAIPIKQKGMINCFIQSQEIFHITSEDCAFGITNTCHDMSLFDLFGMPMYGGSVVLASQDNWKDTSLWIQLMKQYSVTVWNSVPTFMETLLAVEKGNANDAVSGLRVLIQGGDYVKPKVVSKIFEINPECAVYSVGGPSETTIWNIYHKVSRDDVATGIIPYGKPIANTVYYILNQNRRPVKPGVVGTMFVKGIGVSDGYINLPELTREKFISEVELLGKGMLYNTGDLGYFREDGTIVFCGRDDKQIKINGKRIELDGIARCAEEIEGIHKAIAVFKENHIFLYYEGREQGTEFLKEELAERLPIYMLPSGFRHMDKIPINSNGKVSDALLPDIEADYGMQANYVAKNDEVEQFIINACKTIMETDSITIHDNFFEFGGNSIRMIKLIAMIRDKYHVKLAINDIFMNPNLYEWHDMIMDQIATGQAQESMKQEVSEELKQYPVCMNQEGLWVSEMLHPASTYTMNVYTEITGAIDIGNLKKAFWMMACSHKALHVTFDIDDEGVPYQEIGELPTEENIPFVYHQLDEDESYQSYMRSLNHKILDIESGPLYRATLIRRDTDKYTFVFTCHHIVCDEQSFIMIMKQIFALYNQLEENKTPNLVSEKESFAEYCLKNSHKDIDTSYWKNILTDKTLQPLPFRGEQEDRNSRLSFSLCEEEANLIDRFCRKNQVSEYILLITLMSMAIAEVSMENEMVILSPFSDRINMGYEDTVGFFIKNVAIKLSINENADFLETLNQSKASIMMALENAEAPFEGILRELNLSQFADRTKRVVFNLIDSERKGVQGKKYLASHFKYLKEEFNNPTGLNIFAENVLNTIQFDFMIHEQYISIQEATRVRDSFLKNFNKYIKQ